jgi:hypothetical protein
MQPRPHADSASAGLRRIPILPWNGQLSEHLYLGYEKTGYSWKMLDLLISDLPS